MLLRILRAFFRAYRGYESVPDKIPSFADLAADYHREYLEDLSRSVAVFSGPHPMWTVDRPLRLIKVERGLSFPRPELPARNMLDFLHQHKRQSVLKNRAADLTQPNFRAAIAGNFTSLTS
jgi:hypothetical protein